MKQSSSQMAGWLFADLLLALVVVFIGSEVQHHRSDAVTLNKNVTPSPNPSAARNEAGRLEPTPTDTKPIEVDVNKLATGSKSEFSKLEAEFAGEKTIKSLDENNRYAALVEVFSWTPVSNLGPGNDSSEKICTWLKDRGGLTNRRTICQAYIKTSLSKNHVFVRLFLVAK